MKTCPNCGLEVVPHETFGPILGVQHGHAYHGAVPKFVDNEEGLDNRADMGGETSLGELSGILEEVGCDGIPARFHKLTLDDLDRWMDGR